jgi:L-2-hydroxyglutarate oxidase LhgO
MKLILTFALLSLTLVSNAQGVVVNADGTHSQVINNGSTSMIVNPNGTHSTAFNNGNTSVIFNPNGTLSTAFRNGNTSVVFNSDGTTSTMLHPYVASEEEEETESPRYAYARPWGSGPLVPEGVFVDLSQWKSGPVFWVNVKKYRRKLR